MGNLRPTRYLDWMKYLLEKCCGQSKGGASPPRNDLSEGIRGDFFFFFFTRSATVLLEEVNDRSATIFISSLGVISADIWGRNYGLVSK